MASGSCRGMFTDKVSIEVGDIKAGSSYGQVSDIERKASLIEAPTEKMENVGDVDVRVFEIEKWACSLKRILEEVPQYMCSPGHPGRITRIPENLREIDVKAYEPYFVSIGPYHNGKSGLEETEKRKHLILKCFLKQKPELTLKDYLVEIGTIETAARSFYSDIEMGREKFVHMLLLDSLFILTTFCGVPKGQKNKNPINTRIESTKENGSMNGRENHKDEGDIRTKNGDGNRQMIVKEDDPNIVNSGGQNVSPRLLAAMFVHDLFLLENQIPFFVLQKMHILAYGGSDRQLLSIMKVVVGNMLTDYTKLDSELVISPSVDIHHLLHLCHLFFCPTFQPEPTTCQFVEPCQMFRLASAVQLYESGVNFFASSDSTQHSLLDITFCSSGKMTMPCLHVDDNTNSLLRNLIAMEQMKYPTMGLNVSSYAVLLLHLVTVPEDVGLLRRKGIIQHHLASDKDMMYLVNRLSIGLAFDYMEDTYSLKPVFQQLKCYSERKIPRWKTWLKHRHCNNPWTVISLIAASLLLILSAIQTYYSVYSYYYPCFDCHS